MALCDSVAIENHNADTSEILANWYLASRYIAICVYVAFVIEAHILYIPTMMPVEYGSETNSIRKRRDWTCAFPFCFRSLQPSIWPNNASGWNRFHCIIYSVRFPPKQHVSGFSHSDSVGCFRSRFDLFNARGCNAPLWG